MRESGVSVQCKPALRRLCTCAQVSHRKERHPEHSMSFSIKWIDGDSGAGRLKLQICCIAGTARTVGKNVEVIAKGQPNEGCSEPCIELDCPVKEHPRSFVLLGRTLRHVPHATL